MRALPVLALVLTSVACGSTPPESLEPDAVTVDAATGSAQPTIPSPTGTCPTLVSGDVTFAPSGIPPRKVSLSIDPGAPELPGELVIYWHATGSSPREAEYSLGATHAAITSRGGVVAAPYSDDAAGQFEWYIVNGSTKPDDFVLADEIVACLAAAQQIDPLHVHSMGMSAGGLQTSAFSFLRSSYIASVATFSGGLPDGFTPANQNRDNKFAALIFAGGVTDNVFGLDFKAASERYKQLLTADGHYATICDHGKGHEIPLDAAPSIATFFVANGYGAWPSPYATGLPASFPAYCNR